MPETRKAATRTAKTSAGFTDDEKAAMRERSREVAAARRRGPSASAADGEADLKAKVAAMPPADRAMAERLDAMVKAVAPDLVPRTYYGMPAYARDGSVICYFKAASKFKERFATLGFTDKAQLDDGNMWPKEYALTRITAVEEKRIEDLLRRTG
jgi:uncharacterized protein YdhG (YjbR/CyaY superfamily)